MKHLPEFEKKVKRIIVSFKGLEIACKNAQDNIIKAFSSNEMQELIRKLERES